MSHTRMAQARRRARELAVQLLYSLGNRFDQSADGALDLFCGEGGVAESDLPEVKEYLRFLVRGAWTRRSESDDVLLRVITGWRPERIVSVDRAVLRLAVFEGFLERSVPFAVAISEAVDIAQTFGTEDSGRFVNGVLARVVQHLIPESERNKSERNKKNAGKKRGEGQDHGPSEAGTLPADR